MRHQTKSGTRKRKREIFREIGKERKKERKQKEKKHMINITNAVRNMYTLGLNECEFMIQSLFKKL